MSDAAGSVKVVLTVDAASYSAALDKANSKIKQFGAASEAAGHASVSSSQAASAAIRSLNGGMDGSIRAAEKFLSTIPGIGSALQAAFPVVGALALAGVFAKMGKEVVDFIDKTQKVPKAIQQGFAALELGQRSATASLDVTNDKLENQIAKLEHKPQNNIKLALDEARDSADKFATSMEAAQKRVAELLEQNKIGMVGGFVTGQSSTSKLSGTINSYQQQMSDLADQKSQASDSGDTAGAAKFAKQLADMRVSYKKALQDEVAKGDTTGGFWNSADNSGNVRMGRGALNLENAQERQEKSEATHDSDEGQLSKLQGNKDAANDRKQLEELMMKQDEDAEKKQNAFNKLSVNEEIQFWSDRIKAFTQGGQAYMQVQNKIYDLIASRPSLAAQNKENQAKSGKSQVEGENLLSSGDKAFGEVAAEQYERAAQSAKQYAQAVAKGAQITDRNAQAMQESAVGIELQQGSITKLAAAQALAAVHADEHAKALQDVNTALAEQIDLINSDPKLSDADKANAIRNANASSDNQKSELNGANQVTKQQDDAAVFAQTIGGKWSTGVNQMVQQWGDMTGHLIEVFSRTADGLNDDLVKALTHKSGTRTHLGVDVRNTLSQGAGGIAKAGLEKSESSVMGMFGLGTAKKADGSASAPFHVIMAGIANATSSASGAVSSAVSGAGGGGGIFGQVGGFLKSMGVPFLAGGGDAMAGQPHVIGEEGPELFVPKVSGTVVPNGKFGGGTHTTHVDARGSTNPAETEAAVHRAMSQYIPGIVKSSVSAVTEKNRRSPLSKR
jgi:hypothetical protein